jgi:tRNA(His) 5'-end guanylyltransferase
MFDPRGDILKKLEMEEAGRKMVMELPVIARLDGRAFHTYTRGMARPYDYNFSRCMWETAGALLKEFHAKLAYVQSDEITLVWEKPIHFDGRYQKMCSVLASYAGVVFNRLAEKALPAKKDIIATFDCRVFQVESIARVKEVVEWRENDATRNSILSAGQAYFSHKELHGQNTNKVQDMLHSKGINWNDYPAFFKRGTYLKKMNVRRELTYVEWSRIPEKHRPPLDTVYIRSEVRVLDMDLLSSYTLLEFGEMFFPMKSDDVEGAGTDE